MADRSTYNESSSPMPNGLQFLEQYAHLFGLLFNTSVLPLTAVGGTGNAVTASLDPPLLGGLVTGMKFTLTWAAANTGPVTLALNGGAAVPVVDAAGLDLVAGDLDTGLRGLIEFVGGVFRLLSSAGSNEGVAPYSTVITTSITWLKPPGYADDALVRVQCWAGGGGGATSAGNGFGGGGGGYAERILRYADVPASVICTIGAGGPSGTAGGNTTFGSLLTAYRGGAGGTTGAGGGGGELGPGGNNNGVGGAIGGGTSAAPDARTIWGGAAAGGDAYLGGAGGGNKATGSGNPAGTSLFGGNGGAGVGAGVGMAGTAPGGGGGAGVSAGGAGARGEIRIQIFG